MKKPEILVGVSGGIACYKSAELVSRLVKQDYGVSVVMTESATRFVGAATFEALTDRPVSRELFEPHQHFLGEHIGLARRADLFVIAPATANAIGKLANGIADDLLSTVALSVTCPVIVAPAMNVEMWNKASLQRNVEQLKQDGIKVIDPGEGWLSCRIQGKGRMAEPDEIFDIIEATLAADK